MIDSFQDAAIDDGFDRMNRQYTVLLFLIILIFLGLKQFVGDPIECFTPQYFSGNWKINSTVDVKIFDWLIGRQLNWLVDR